MSGSAKVRRMFYPACTMLDVVRDAARMRPERLALWFKGARFTYASLDGLSNAVAAGLIAEGVRPGDRVALLLPNVPQAVLGQLGAWKAGAVVVPLSPLYAAAELEHALRECGATAIVCLSAWRDRVLCVQPRTPLRRVVTTDALDTMARRRAAAPEPESRAKPDDAALMLFTGGTTGRPKAAVGTHQALVTSALQTQAWFREVLVPEQDVVLLAMPLFHVYGNVGGLGTSLVAGHPVALVPDPRDIDDLLTTIAELRPAFLPAVPSLLTALVNHPRVRSGAVDLSCLKVCISGASPLLAETRARFEAIGGVRVVDAYSLTEAMNAAVIGPVTGPRTPGAVGRPLPDVELRIVDADARDLPQGKVGEVLLRAPQLMQGYWNRPQESAKAIRSGWLHTGDAGYLGRGGELFLVDRMKDVIKPGGHQVWPRDVEEVIASHPAVSEVGVAGAIDEYGEAVTAWVVLRPGHHVSGDDLRAYCRRSLAPYQVPRHVEFRPSLPKSTVGKVLRRELRKQA